MAQNSLQHHGDKEFFLFSFCKQVSYIISTQVAVYVEALIEKQLDKLFAVKTTNGLLKQAVFYFDLRVIIALEYFGQCKCWTIPVQCEAKISLDLSFALFAWLLCLSFWISNILN